MIVASYGGGTNSTAMLIGMVERGEKVDLVIFADTGGEQPHTYRHIREFSDWLVGHGMPAITVVREHVTLEDDVLRRHGLPSIAFGFKTCSQRFKLRPFERHLKAMGVDLSTVTKLIGFDADEPHRAKEIPGNRYPLIEWGWGRDECVETIRRAGVSQPGKSSCFFCPSMKKHEILQMARMYPGLAARAVAMEENAHLDTVKGLGRGFAWKDLLHYGEAQIDAFPESLIEIDCGCYDGAPDERRTP